MALTDPLANTLSKIWNCEKISRKEVTIMPVSKLIKQILDLMNKNNYLGKYKIIKDNRGEILQLFLLGKINRCNVIKPRFSIKKNEFEKFEKRFLPAKDFGILILSTSKGIMTHNEAKEKGLGGKLLAYVY